MANDLAAFEVGKLTRNALDDVRIGDWFWVNHKDWGEDKPSDHLMCVDEIGSNFVGFAATTEHGQAGCRIHVGEFFAKCRPEPLWRDVLKKRLQGIQKAIKDKTAELIGHGQRLCLLKPADAEPEEAHTLLPVKVADAPVHEDWPNKM